MGQNKRIATKLQKNIVFSLSSIMNSGVVIHKEIYDQKFKPNAFVSNKYLRKNYRR